jgi:Protein of unknown function (DUF998)
MNHPRLSTRSLATATLTALGTFPVLVVVLHAIQGGRYHPMGQAVSELALGRAGWLMAVAFCAAGAGMLGLAALIRRTLPRSRVIQTLITTSGLFSFVSAGFHTDGDNKTTSHGQIHQISGVVSFILVVTVMFICSRRFRREPRWQPFAVATRLWAWSSVGTFLLVPVLGQAHFGLAQRIFLAVWLSWPITLTAHARRQTLARERDPSLSTPDTRTVHA